jgi:uncharacterized protein
MDTNKPEIPEGFIDRYAPQAAPQEEPKPPFYNRFIEAGREGLNKFQHYLGTSSLVIGGYIIGQAPLIILMAIAVARGYLDPKDPEIKSKILNPEILHQPPWLLLACELFIFVVAMLGLWFGVKFIQQKKFLSIITGHQPFRIKRVLSGIIIWGTLQILLLVIALWQSPGDFEYTFNLSQFIPVLIVAVLMLPIQTWFEEFYVRGNLLQGFAFATKSPWLSILITSLIFAGLHMFNPEAVKYGRLAVLPQYLLPAILFGVIAVLDEGLELAMGMHFINNLFGTVVLTSSDSAIQASTIWRNNAPLNMTAENISYTIIMLVVIAFLWWRYKWKADKLFRLY